jgi:tetratricopeptide (TPR) repeat protein
LAPNRLCGKIAFAVPGSESAEVPREVIIFVHGTGAGSRDTRNPRWWQPVSTFSHEFSKLLGNSYCIGKPFRWSGANLESHRRNAGARLLRRLRTLEAEGRSYHLVGHSHGGSVIWHALIASIKRGEPPLTGLKSWTTIGTPFLTFALDVTAWRHVLGLIVSVAVIATLWQLFLEGITEHSVIWRDSNPWGVCITLVMFAALATVFAMFLVRVLRYLWVWRHCRALTEAEGKAANYYGGKWLGIWHQYDEPISGLRATLTDPLQLVSPRADRSAGLLKRVAWFWYDFAFVPVTNQWAWGIGMGHAQGSDLFSWRMSRASSAPVALQPGWAPLPLAVGSAIAKSADTKAANASAALRIRLRAAGDYGKADEAVASLAAVLTWQELIHTSYFEHSAIHKLIAGHVRDASAMNAIESSKDELDQWRRSRPPASAELVVRHRRRLALPIVRLAQMLGTTLLIAIAASASYSAWVAPFTERTQIDEIARRTLGQSLFVIENSSSLAETILRLIALDRIGNIEKVLRELENSNRLTVERIATAAGFSYPNLRHFNFEPPLPSPTSNLDPIPIEEMLYRLGFLYESQLAPKDIARVKLASALLIAGNAVPGAVADELFNSLRGADTIRTWIRRRPTDVEVEYDPEQNTEVTERNLTETDLALLAEAAAILYYLGRADNAAEIVSIIDGRLQDPCANAYKIGVQVARLGSGDLDAIISRCPAKRVKIIFDATFAAWAAGHSDVAKELFRKIPPENSNPDRLLLSSWILLQLDQGLIEEAVVSAERLLTEGAPLTSSDSLELAAQFRSAGKPDIATRIINQAVESNLSAHFADANIYGDSYFKAAEILAAEGRKPEVLDLARSFEARAANIEGDSEEKARYYVNAAAVYKAGVFYPEAIAQLSRAVKIKPTLNAHHGEQFEAACKIISVASPVSHDFVTRGINRAMQIIKNVPSFEERVTYYLALSKRAAAENELFIARGLAESLSDPDKVLEGYAQILDTYLRKNDPDTWRAWGLSHPQTQHFFWMIFKDVLRSQNFVDLQLNNLGSAILRSSALRGS